MPIQRLVLVYTDFAFSRYCKVIFCLQVKIRLKLVEV